MQSTCCTRSKNGSVMNMSDFLSAMRINDAYVSLSGVTARDRSIAKAKRDFEQKVVDSPGSCINATRNDRPQRFLVTQSDVFYKCTVTAYPGEDLFPGDILSFCDEHWIVQQTKLINAIQIVGTAWLCNHKFRFQAFSSEIHERWGVLDSGVYSTTRTSDSTVAALDMQYKIYLPGDEATQMIHEDQRIATDRWVDKNGDKILLTYAVTGRDLVSKSYGNGAHLLVLNARSSSYNAEKDDYEKMICDYIADEFQPEDHRASLKIVGRDYIRIGSSRPYRMEIEENIGLADSIDQSYLEWSLESSSSIRWRISDGDGIIIEVPDDCSLSGETIVLNVAHKEDKYTSDTMKIEVVP